MMDLVVLSDLHLGLGRNPETGRFHRLEAFFRDQDFRAFCDWLVEDAARRERRLRLILNGDVLDLLRNGDGEAAVRARAILAAHADVVAGWAHLLAAGHEIVMLPGNHDLELQRPNVQAEVRAAVGEALAGSGAGHEPLARLTFEPWFHHEPGRIWIEHGSQYDPQGGFRYLLRGAVAGDEERDMPLGNFWQRYLYNALGALTFAVPSTDGNAGYLRWLAFHRPRAVARVAAQHLPFAVRLVRRVARAAASGPPARLAQAHEAHLTELAHESGLGDRLRAIDALKQVGDLADATWRVARQILWVGLAAFLLALLAFGLWSVGHLAIGALRVGLGPKAALALVFAFGVLAIGGAGLLIFLLRTPEARRFTLAPAAARVAALADVPLVVFGHNHQEAVSPLPRSGRRRGWYFNTGTWITVFLGDDLVPRERSQLTFLRVTGLSGELLYWSPERGRPMPAILLDD